MLAPVDVAALAQDCLGLVQPVAQARGVLLGLDLAAAPACCMALADSTRLRQVLLNLLSNAIKFSPAGAQVRLACRIDSGGAAMAPGHAPGPGSVLIEVADQGAGIAPAHVPRLFQAFERLDQDRAVEGSGSSK